MLEVPARERPQPVGREERLLVEQPLEDPQQVLDARRRRPGAGASPGSPIDMALGRVAVEPEVAAVDQPREPLADASALAASTCSSITANAVSGRIPTIERTSTGTTVPSGRRSWS